MRFLFLFVLVGSFAAHAGAPASFLRVMHYNVENLFDVNHDENKDDWEYLPKGFPGRESACKKKGSPRDVEACLENDWTQEKLSLKLEQIRKVIDASGALPDLLSIVEIENHRVAGLLAQTLGYDKFVITESPDERGIDVALFYKESSRLKFLSSESLGIPVEVAGKPTRDILKAIFKVGNETLAVFVNHWPSQAAPSKVRRDVAALMMVEARAEAKKGHLVLSLGDFNVIAKDRPDPFYEVLEAGKGDFSLVDIDSEFRRSKDNYEVIKTLPLGSYFYGTNMEWNLLDRIFVSPDLLRKSSLHMDLSSYRIFNPLFLQAAYSYSYGPHSGSIVKGIPWRYNHNADSVQKAGFSDHFPVFVDLVAQ